MDPAGSVRRRSWWRKNVGFNHGPLTLKRLLVIRNNATVSFNVMNGRSFRRLNAIMPLPLRVWRLILSGTRPKRSRQLVARGAKQA